MRSHEGYRVRLADCNGYRGRLGFSLDGKVAVSAELRFAAPISGRFALEPFVTGFSVDAQR
jgi:hypothetical protein